MNDSVNTDHKFIIHHTETIIFAVQIWCSGLECTTKWITVLCTYESHMHHKFKVIQTYITRVVRGSDYAVYTLNQELVTNNIA